MTGVQRHAFELASALGKYQKVDYIYPPKAMVNGLKAHLWEQCILPWRMGNSVLLSLANTGPLLKKQQAITIHDMAFMDHPEWFSRSFRMVYQFLIPRLAKRAKWVLTDSEYSKSRIVHHCYVRANKVFVVHCGVARQFVKVPEAACLEVLNKHQVSKPYVLCVGSLEPRKNLAGLLRAWATIPAADRLGAELLIVGGAGKSFSGLGFEQLPDATRLLGYVDDADLPALYSGAKAFVYPSLYEGFGLPPLEAMACGTPVITSNVTSIPEVVGEAALLIDPKSPKQIADAIRKLLADGILQQQLREKGMAQAQEFTWEKAAQRVIQILNSEDVL
jgi:glycosyltransferase involved in cell wall biosynthesis